MKLILIATLALISASAHAGQDVLPQIQGINCDGLTLSRQSDEDGQLSKVVLGYAVDGVETRFIVEKANVSQHSDIIVRANNSAGETLVLRAILLGDGVLSSCTDITLE